MRYGYGYSCCVDTSKAEKCYGDSNYVYFFHHIATDLRCFAWSSVEVADALIVTGCCFDAIQMSAHNGEDILAIKVVKAKVRYVCLFINNSLTR